MSEFQTELKALIEKYADQFTAKANNVRIDGKPLTTFGGGNIPFRDKGFTFTYWLKKRPE